MSNILLPIKNALQAMVAGFVTGTDGLGEQDAHNYFTALVPVFSQVGDFPKKMSELDVLNEEYSSFLPIQEYVFDLLMLNFIASDSSKMGEAYLDSPEWLQIEDETADRGSELLNILLYITECLEAEKKPKLDDFLHEFLLTEDELYQDEFFIYEPVIKHVDLENASINEIIKAGKSIEEDELKELFIPLMTFFNKLGTVESRYKSLEGSDFQTAMNLALFACMTAFADALKE